MHKDKSKINKMNRGKSKKETKKKTRDAETKEQRNNKYIVRETRRGNIIEQSRQWMYERN